MGIRVARRSASRNRAGERWVGKWRTREVGGAWSGAEDVDLERHGPGGADVERSTAERAWLIEMGLL